MTASSAVVAVCNNYQLAAVCNNYQLARNLIFMAVKEREMGKGGERERDLLSNL